MCTLDNAERLQGPFGFDVGEGPSAEADEAEDQRQDKGEDVKSGLMTEGFHWYYFT